mgnify:CR=1 FL=1
MTRNSRELETLAEQILDQGEVDWTRLSARTRLDAAETVDGLRLLEDLVRGFRHAQVDGDTRVATRTSATLFRFAGLEVRELLGRGSNGEVYRAYDPLLDQDVALKLRHAGSDSLAHQFIAEARRLVRVRHANVVSVYGAAIDGDRVGLWMELVHGETLASRLEHGPASLPEALAIGAELCAALSAVHRHGLVHGDLKAENVLCEPGGRIVLADFGSCREIVAARSAGVVSGTLQYLAPEVLRGGPTTPASDVYALGVLLYRLLSGRFPYPGERYEELVAQQCLSAPPLVSQRAGLPRALGEAIDRCLATDPKRRPASAADLARALDRAMQPPVWRRPAFLAVTAMTLATLAIAAGFLDRIPIPEWRNELTLYRVASGKSAAISTGTRVQVGDGLQLAFRSNEQTWLYVLDDDGSGNAAVLFPVTGFEPDNPLVPGALFTLPRNGAQQLSWTISGGAPREEILVIASRKPQPALERLFGTGWQAASLPSAIVARGASTLTPAAVPGTLDSAILQAALAEAQKAGPGQIQQWHFELPHAD